MTYEIEKDERWVSIHNSQCQRELYISSYLAWSICAFVQILGPFTWHCFQKQWNVLKMRRKRFSVLVHFCHVNVPLETASEYYNPWCLCACVLMETGSSCIMAANHLRKLLWACLSKVMTIKPEIRENVFMLNRMQQTHLQVSMSTVDLKSWNAPS